MKSLCESAEASDAIVLALFAVMALCAYAPSIVVAVRGRR